MATTVMCRWLVWDADQSAACYCGSHDRVNKCHNTLVIVYIAVNYRCQYSHLWRYRELEKPYYTESTNSFKHEVRLLYTVPQNWQSVGQQKVILSNRYHKHHCHSFHWSICCPFISSWCIRPSIVTNALWMISLGSVYATFVAKLSTVRN